MQPTDISDPQYFHKVVDCQYACPAHTPVPEYIRLIAQERYTEAYMLNWDSNVFPGILGRTCDRPCEPACRRVRTEEKPVAICRLKRVAADNKGDISAFMPRVPTQKNGKRIALIGAGPASLAVARDLLPLGYEVHLFEKESKGGGFMRSQIPAFRLPVEVLDEEVEQILDMGVECHFGQEITSMKSMLDMDFDAYFIGTGAPGVETWTSPDVKLLKIISISASTGCPALRLAIPPALKAKSLSWVAVTQPWTVVAPHCVWARNQSKLWCVPPSRS